MVTRFYFPSSGSAAITPAGTTTWEDTSINAALPLVLTKTSTAMTTVTFADADLTNKDILFRQYVSERPVISWPAGNWKMQMRGTQDDVDNNMFLAVGVWADDGVANAGGFGATRDTTNELVVGTLTNRTLTGAIAAFNSATSPITGKAYLVVSIGTGGDPAAAGATGHDSTLRIGDAAASDLAEDDSSTADNNPWIEFDFEFAWGQYPPNSGDNDPALQIVEF